METRMKMDTEMEMLHDKGSERCKREVSDCMENNFLQRSRQMKIHWKKRAITEEFMEYRQKNRYYKKLLTKPRLLSINYDNMQKTLTHQIFLTLGKSNESNE